MELKFILSELQNRFGFSNLNQDNNGVFSVIVNKKFTLNLAEAPDRNTFFMYSDIMNVVPDPNAKIPVYERILGANLFGKETHGAYFAYDTSRGAIVLIKRFDARLVDYNIFFEEFRDFINGLSHWDQVVTEGQMEPAKAAEHPFNPGHKV